MENTVVSLAIQLATASPTLIVYLAGMILAVVFWRRSSTASLLCLLGLVLLFVTAVVQLVVTPLVIRNVSYEKIGTLMSIIGVIGSLARAVGMGLLMGAVFSDRKTKPAARPEAMPLDEQAPFKTGGRNITRPLGGEAFTTDR